MIGWQNCHSMIFVGAIANRLPMDQECSLYMTTGLGPVKATLKKNKKKTFDETLFSALHTVIVKTTWLNLRTGLMQSFLRPSFLYFQPSVILSCLSTWRFGRNTIVLPQWEKYHSPATVSIKRKLALFCLNISIYSIFMWTYNIRFCTRKVWI